MALTSAQKTALKAAIVADNTLNSKPNNPDGNVEIATALNQLASPDYWVWHPAVSRSTIYNETSDLPSSWDWSTYKAQAVAEQNAWVQMFMGDAADFGKVNLRSGVASVFSGSAAQNNQRAHVFANARRKATRAEKACAVAVTSPPANTGNDGVAGNRGKTTNPDVLTLIGNITSDDVESARNS